jgi:dienelactone hydrolase
VCLVGFSWGGATALRVAAVTPGATHPDQLTRSLLAGIEASRAGEAVRI